MSNAHALESGEQPAGRRVEAMAMRGRPPEPEALGHPVGRAAQERPIGSKLPPRRSTLEPTMTAKEKLRKAVEVLSEA